MVRGGVVDGQRTESRPKFRPDITVTEHSEAGQKNSVILKDPVSQKYYRLTPYEFRFLQALDGTVTVDEAAEKLTMRGLYYPTDEARSLVRRAAEMGLLLGTEYSSARFLREKQKRIQAAKIQRRFSSLYFLFIPLWNPDRFLEKTVWLFRAISTKWTAQVASVLAAGSLYLVISGLPNIETEYLFFFNWQNVLFLWITIAFTKLAHEFAHAYTAKSMGLHVPQMGIAFLIFLPCLYCNTTDAWQLANRKERMAISAAGIAVEGALAVLSVYVWYFTRPGIVHWLAFYLMAVSFVSTVLFNGNPLMKFDGYFILSDYLRIPNLASKAWLYLRYLFMNQVLGLSRVSDPSENTRESTIFGIYGFSSLVYRFFLYTGIVAGVYYRFDKFLGVVLAAVALILFVVRPLVKGMITIALNRKEIRFRTPGTYVAGTLVGLALLVLLVPMSSKSVFPCYLDSQRVQKLTVPLQTSISDLFIREGSAVKAGDLLMRLDTTRLRLSLANKQIERELASKEMDLLLLDEKEMAKASSKSVEISQLDHEIAILKKHLNTAEQGMVAPFDSVVTMLDYRVQPGFQPGEGSVVGELKSQTECIVRALISEDDVAQISPGQSVEIWFPVDSRRVFLSNIGSVKPYSEKDLPESPFSSRLGGEVPTEPAEGGRQDAPLTPQYVASCRFMNENLLPLGITGEYSVASLPRSILSRLLRAAASTFNRESLL